jgi:hypothetical protein
MKVLIWLLDRFVPTLLIGASAALLAVGLLSYAPAAFGLWQTPVPTVGGDPLFETTGPDGGVAWASGEPSGSDDLPSAPPTPVTSLAPGATPSPAPTYQPPPTYLPTGTPPTGGPTQPPSTPTPHPVPAGNAPPTRVVIPSLDIDLPVVPSDLEVRGNEGNYPLCDVAMYMVGFANPGRPGTTYIYGHAQAGMFAPLLHASKYNDGASMIGALVEVYTDDNKLHLYEIKLVKRHATDLSITRIPAGTHQLVLQTSEGWHGHIPKLQVAARPLTVLPASYRDAHPTPHPRVCLPS